MIEKIREILREGIRKYGLSSELNKDKLWNIPQFVIVEKKDSVVPTWKVKLYDEYTETLTFNIRLISEEKYLRHIPDDFEGVKIEIYT